jgi:hypothetical protein
MRLLKFHPFVTKIFMMIVLSTRHPHFICGRSSSFYSYDQCRIQCVSRKITCIGLRTHTLSNITSFWLNHIARQKVHTSIRILYICFLSIPYTHPLNIWWIFKGGDILKETYIILQMYLAHGQSKKRCCIDLSSNILNCLFIFSLQGYLWLHLWLSGERGETNRNIISAPPAAEKPIEW